MYSVDKEQKRVVDVINDVIIITPSPSPPPPAVRPTLLRILSCSWWLATPCVLRPKEQKADWEYTYSMTTNQKKKLPTALHRYANLSLFITTVRLCAFILVFVLPNSICIYILLSHPIIVDRIRSDPIPPSCPDSSKQSILSNGGFLFRGYSHRLQY